VRYGLLYRGLNMLVGDIRIWPFSGITGALRKNLDANDADVSAKWNLMIMTGLTKMHR